MVDLGATVGAIGAESMLSDGVWGWGKGNRRVNE